MNPNSLKATLLEDATTEQQKEFAKMLAEQCAEADLRAKGHKCWFFVPDDAALEAMKKYNKAPDWDKCPKCKKGRIVVEIHRCSLGMGLSFQCYFNNCDFREDFWDNI